MKDIVARCMQWSSVSVSQTTTQKCVEAVEGNCAAKMLTPIGTREERLCRETRQRNLLQIVEIPPITPQVEEHRLHQLECQYCGTLTRAELPSQVNLSGYGPGVVATVAVLSGVVSPQSENGAKRHARLIWGVYVFGQRQSPAPRG